MRRVRCGSMLAAVAMIAALCTPAFAQKVVSSKVGGGGSPHETVEYTIDGAKITISYGKPFLKGRSLDTLAPAGKVWRLGADEATIITSDKPLMIGSLMLPAGSHSLYALPNPGAWKLIVNKKTGQWGIPYPKETQDQELGRTDLKEGKTAKPAENFTILLADTPAGADLKLQWGTMEQTVAIMVH
jgi:Protein of unknown function (DUF2911)